MNRRFRSVVSGTIVLALSLAASVRVVAQTGNDRVGGMVAADHPLAAEAGASLLRQGGNAVDAAVATSFALSVVRPDACGIGGGGFMVIHLVDDPRHGTRTVAINYRETCPLGIGPKTFVGSDDPSASRIGGLAVAVPGTVAGLLHALERYGTVDRAVALAPAIELAERGFPADEHHVRTARSLHGLFLDRAELTERFPLVWLRFMDKGRIEVGDTIRLPEQARALRLIAEHGRDAFYHGEIAEAMAASVGATGGVLTLADLVAYRVAEVEPIVHDVGGWRVISMPPPSSGGVAVTQILAMSAQIGLSVPGTGWPDPGETHRLAEIMRHAFADRSRHMADPAFTEVPLDRMLDRAALERAAALVNGDHARPAHAYGVALPLTDDGGTSHISVIDAHGNAVACTETINLAFGSLVGVEGFGFCLNNQMDDFTTVPGRANAFGLVQSDANLPEPGKRPLSSMSPTIVLDADGRVIAVAGASGGPRIISATAQVLLRLLVGGSTPAQAVEAPRIHHQWIPDTLVLEARAGVEPPGSLVGSLEQVGHTVTHRDMIGAVQVVVRDPVTGEVSGAADPRKGGAAVRP